MTSILNGFAHSHVAPTIEFQVPSTQYLCMTKEAPLWMEVLFLLSLLT